MERSHTGQVKLVRTGSPEASRIPLLPSAEASRIPLAGSPEASRIPLAGSPEASRIAVTLVPRLLASPVGLAVEDELVSGGLEPVDG